MREKKVQADKLIDQYPFEKRNKRIPLPTPDFPTPTPNKDLLRKYLPKAATICEQQIILPQTASPKSKKRSTYSPVKSLRRVESLHPPIPNPELKAILDGQRLVFDFEKLSGIPGISASQPFQQLALEMGANICESLLKGVTVIVTDKKTYSKTMRKALESGVPSVSMLWLADCRQFKRKLPFETYLVPVGGIKIEGKVSKESKSSDTNQMRIPQNLKKLIKSSAKQVIARQQKGSIFVKQLPNESKAKYAIVFQRDLSQTESALSVLSGQQPEKQNSKKNNLDRQVNRRKSKSRASKQSNKSTRSIK